MTDPGFIAQAATFVYITIAVVGVVMGIWWKKIGFKGSPSKGIGKSPFRRKKYDYDKDEQHKSTTETEFATPPDDDEKQ